MIRKMGCNTCLCVAFILASQVPFAKSTQGAQGSSEKVKEIAHIAIPGSAVRQIFLQEENGKKYLYLQQKVHFTVVDVSDPAKPQIVDRVASGGKLTEVGAGLAIAIQSDKAPGPVATQTVRLMDMSDPKNPHTAKTYTGVTSVFSEDGRHLIYLTNSDGLRVVEHYQKFRLPLCTSESEENSVAQCQ